MDCSVVYDQEARGLHLTMKIPEECLKGIVKTVTVMASRDILNAMLKAELSDDN